MGENQLSGGLSHNRGDKESPPAQATLSVKGLWHERGDLSVTMQEDNSNASSNSTEQQISSQEGTEQGHCSSPGTGAILGP